MKKNEALVKKVGCRVDQELLGRFQAQVQELDINQADVIRGLIENWVIDRERDQSAWGTIEKFITSPQK